MAMVPLAMFWDRVGFPKTNLFPAATPDRLDSSPSDTIAGSRAFPGERTGGRGPAALPAIQLSALAKKSCAEAQLNV
jgi:hypothetical protein